MNNNISTKSIQLEDCGKLIGDVKPDTYIINSRIAMVVKAPRGTLALFEEWCSYGGKPWSEQCEMLRNFMAAHSCVQDTQCVQDVQCAQDIQDVQDEYIPLIPYFDIV